MNVRERVIVHGLLKVDRVENLDPIPAALEQFPSVDHDVPFRVLSIRIEKKANYFYEVTVSD